MALVASLLLCLTTTAALSASLPPPLPLPRPGAPDLTGLLNKADGAYFIQALKTIETGNWPAATALTAKVKNNAAAALLTWMRYRAEKSKTTFGEIAAFQARFSHWPQQNLLSTRAEESLLDYSVNDADLLTWFADKMPQTGEGKIRLGQAFLNVGQKENGRYWIRKGWVDHLFNRSREAEILKKYRQLLPRQAHEDRLNHLIWKKRRADARRMFKLVSADAQAVANARIQLIGRSKNAGKTLSKVAERLRGTIGLIYDEARYRRRRGQEDRALALLLAAPAEPGLLERPDRWWGERKTIARNMLEQGRYKAAYELAKAHSHTKGVSFAEGEFLAGWIALRFLNNPEVATHHFEVLQQGVATPISTARATYWRGRAANAQDKHAKARTAFQLASRHTTTFYGQLALAALEGKTARLDLPSKVNSRPDIRAALEATDTGQALRLLYEVDYEEFGRIFALHLARTLHTHAELAALSDFMTRIGRPSLAVRISKIAAGRNIILPERAYPTSTVPHYRSKGRQVEKALVYGISRQESEFDTRAVSPAGARGLMQLMPATARRTARKIGVPYRRPYLLNDPGYNAMLGSAHLGELLETFSGSYIMSIAAYNAGARHVRKWTGKFGDPRSGSVDAIDWIESIPFSETRNYVQRVLENVQIYRVRLNGNHAALNIAQDLNRYEGPPLVSRPIRAPDTAALPLPASRAKRPYRQPLPEPPPTRLPPPATPPAARLHKVMPFTSAPTPFSSLSGRTKMQPIVEDGDAIGRSSDTPSAARIAPQSVHSSRKRVILTPPTVIAPLKTR